LDNNWINWIMPSTHRVRPQAEQQIPAYSQLAFIWKNE